MKRAEIKMINEKTFTILLGGSELGNAKTHSDASFHMHAINEALEDSYREGHKKGIEEGKGREHRCFCGWCRQDVKCPYGP